MIKNKKDFYISKNTAQSVRDIYLTSIEGLEESGNFMLSHGATETINRDPKSILFTLSRHKFVSKMLKSKEKVLDIGCHDGLGTVIVKNEVKYLLAIDYYHPHIESCKERIIIDNLDFEVYDILNGPLVNKFDGIYSLDVLEHIENSYTNLFLENVKSSLNDVGIAIIGMPSIESQKYASRRAKLGHINCMNGEELVEKCKSHFKYVFGFSMNDEVLHTGFYPMSQYIFALCCK